MKIGIEDSLLQPFVEGLCQRFLPGRAIAKESFYHYGRLCIPDIVIKRSGRIVGVIELKSPYVKIGQNTSTKFNPNFKIDDPMFNLGQLADYMDYYYEKYQCRQKISGFLTNMRECIIVELTNINQTDYPTDEKSRQWRFYHFDKDATYTQTEQFFYRFLYELIPDNIADTFQTELKDQGEGYGPEYLFGDKDETDDEMNEIEINKSLNQLADQVDADVCTYQLHNIQTNSNKSYPSVATQGLEAELRRILDSKIQQRIQKRHQPAIVKSRCALCTKFRKREIETKMYQHLQDQLLPHPRL